MAKSATLNPASMPFFPGGSRTSDDEDRLSMAFAVSGVHEQDRAFMSSVSLSPSDRPSVKSSPSPPSEGLDNVHDAGARFDKSPSDTDWIRRPSIVRPIDSTQHYPSFDSAVAREPSVSSSVDAGSAIEDPVYDASENGASVPMSRPPTLRQSTTPSIGIQNRSRSPILSSLLVASSSPVSSLGSAGQFASNMDYSPNFEAQLRASPMINDILERLTRCEISTREIHRNLNDVHRKVDILLERSMGFASQPEFKDPFAPASSSSSSLSGPSSGMARLSMSGNLAPNQQPLDDIIQISQRLNTLTSSVGQLLALQTQQHMQNVGPTLGGNQIASIGPSQDIPPNQLLSPSLSLPGNVLGHGLPNRPEIRATRTPNPPMRTWSAGSLDLPVRPSDNLSALRSSDALLRDKRRSVSSLMRRDSAGVSHHRHRFPGTH
jgi:translation initiation factor 4A